MDKTPDSPPSHRRRPASTRELGPELAAYIPMDRRQALAHGEGLPDRAVGAALFADISGFTPLMHTFAQELGGQRGAEALLGVLNPLFESLIGPVHHYGGSVISFVGDAITCWFATAGAAHRALACALAMQGALQPHSTVRTPAGAELTLNIKVAAAYGPARRFLVGDPRIMRIDTLAGMTLERMAAAEQHANPNEVVVSREVVEQVGAALAAVGWRGQGQFAVVAGLAQEVPPQPWPALPARALSRAQGHSWVLPEVYAQLRGGGDTLGDLRPATPLFIHFEGLDYDGDDAAGEKLDAFVRWVQRVVRRHGGNLLQLTIGDKGAVLYAVFGAPVAHEDHAARALRAALALRNPPAGLDGIGAMQMGLARGEVWTGLCGAQAQHTYGVMGSDVNLAARLMAAARPGQILAAGPLDQTPGFHLAPLGPRPYKGLAAPVPTYALLGEHLTGARVFAETLVGRDAELQQLLRFAQPLFAGQYAGVAFLYGEAGIGKSRLAYALRESLGERAAWFTAPADPILRQALNPLVHWLKRYLGQSPEATAEENRVRLAQHLARLRARLAAVPRGAAWEKELARTESILGALVGLHWPDSLYERLDARGRHENALLAVKALLLAESCLQPVVLEIEDGHWLDDASRELLAGLTRNVADSPLLVVVTSRYADDGSRPAQALAPETPTLTLDLTALPTAALGEQAGAILGGPVDDALLALLQEKAQGNPFFAQQILYYFREKEVLEQGPAGAWRTREAGFDLPAQVNTILVARIDRLARRVKEVVQAAAVLGREFEVQVLARMLRSDVLPEVQRAEEEQIWSVLRELRYLFKHALLRDAAYEMQLRSRLRGLHRLAAETYEQLYADNLSEHYTALAYHYGQAQSERQEGHYARLAGERAAARFANAEAVHYLSRALELLPGQDPLARYALLLARMKVYDRLGAREAQERDLAALEQLAQTAGDPRRQAEVALGRSDYAWSTGDYPQTVASAREAIAHAQAGRAADLEAAGYFGWGRALWRQGNYAEAQAHFASSLAAAQAAGARQQEASSLRSLGIVYWRQGDYARAGGHLAQALDICRELGDRSNEGATLVNLAGISWEQGDYARARDYTLQSLRIRHEIGDRRGEGVALTSLGEVYRSLGDYAGAADCYRQSLGIAREIGDRQGEGEALGNLSLVSHNRGDDEAAEQYGRQALLVTRSIGERRQEGFAWTDLGHALAGQGRWTEAAAAYQQSLDLRRALGAPSLAMEALAGLARVAAAQGDGTQALAQVEEILAHLHAGGTFDGADEPFRVYLTCCQVLQALRDPRAGQVLSQARRQLQVQASRIPDEPTRRAFLENVPYHRALTKFRSLPYGHRPSRGNI